ncbi:MAG: UbiA family prenyltransferase [Halioglobus sp.]|nr:UbiA family prenyltransferase [Halioglobus sp.]
MESTPGDPGKTVPLCVDLDGTLLNTDTLVETAVLLLKSNPLYVFAMVFWLFSGKANLKDQIASRTHLSVDSLPFNQPLLDWLCSQREVGRELVLVTASNFRIAEAVSDHLNLFSDVIASSSVRNLSAGNKRGELIARFGKGGYDYIGNSRDDLEVWAACRNAVVVNASPAVARSVAPVATIEASFSRHRNVASEMLRAMRPHQWTKNLLVFVSIFDAQGYADLPLLIATIIAFVAFCLCSSSVYLINDLLDLESDRGHKEKCNRPFASGGAPVVLGVCTIPVLLIIAVLLAWAAGTSFLGVLVVYFLITLSYSLYLKSLVLLDVLVLAGLYTLRLIAGAAVAGAVPSVWMVSFSMFIFASLAMVKRYAELKALEKDAGAWTSGRGYHVSDLPIIAQLGTASGYISVLVLALYINSREVTTLYGDQQTMWFLCPLLMYWIGRIWLIAGRGQLNQDPVMFAARDRTSYLIFGLGVLTTLVAL